MITPWAKLAETEAKGGHRRVLARRFRRADGTEVDFEVKDERDGVSVVALTEDRSVILVRQFRVGPELVVDELPGGNIEHGESPSGAACRELLEETGYQPGLIRAVGASLDGGYEGVSWETVHLA